MDDILRGGFIEGAAYIVQGLPGAGKTIFSNQVAYAAAAAGRKVLYVTLLSETHDRMFSALATLDFFDRSRLGNGIAYVSVFQTLRDEGLSSVVGLLRRETQRQGATLLVFDGLLNARDQGDSDLDIKTFLAEVQGQAAFVGCTVLFLTSASLIDGSPEHTMVDGVIELHEEVVGVRSTRRLQVRKSRGTAALGGYHQYQISNSGITAYPRIEAALSYPTGQDKPDQARVPSHVEGLDAIIGGGLPRASVTLLFGPSGSGKTSLGLSFLDGSTAADPGLYFGFYENQARLMMKSHALRLGLEEKVDAGALSLLWSPMTENVLDKLGHELLNAVRRTGAKRLFIDGLGGFERAAIYKPRIVEFMAALTNELRSWGVTTVASWEMSDLFGSTVSSPNTEISSLLDNLMLLRQVEIASRYRRTLSILKIRDGSFDAAIHEIQIGNRGLKIALPLEPVTGAATGLATPLQP